MASASLFLSAIPADAYSGTNAANYADNFALTYNINYPYFAKDDCTNFVSQSVYHGGYAMDGVSRDPTSDYNWWVTGGPGSFQYSHSWSIATDYYSFLTYDYPGGIYEGTAPGTSTNYYTPNSVVTGDVLFYVWGGNRGYTIQHASIQVGIGYDPSYPNGQTWYGNYVDTHVTDHYHAFWSLYPYNAAYRATTTIYFMHIDASNGNN